MNQMSSSPAGDRNVSLGVSIVLGLKNYFNFTGRSSRGAFWGFVLAYVLILLAAATALDFSLFPDITAALEGRGPFVNLIKLLTLIPLIALAVRRLHDVGHSGWWLLICFTGIGVLLILFWAAMAGQRNENKYGPDVEAGR